MSLTFTDIFCGAGGSSTGLVAAGYELKLAANHWATAVETHAANHRDADHLCADINNYDMRKLPPTRVLWASPICTEGSPAGGKKRKKAGNAGHGQLGLEQYGHIPQAGFERTRATFWDVIRATEVHRYDAVMVENVLEVTRDWELFDVWLLGMQTLGYNYQFVSLSSAHAGGDGNDPAPQWRDRIYIVLTRKGIPLPDVEPRPLAWCAECDEVVHAVQSWKKPGRHLGKYGQQYVYRCPNGARCKHALVEPFVLPAAAAIDWADTGERIGDKPIKEFRDKKTGEVFVGPLARSTMARIQAGLDLYPLDRTVLTVNHSGHDGRVFPADTRPLPARTAKIGDGLLVPSGGTWNETAYPTDEPMRTRMANPKGYEAIAMPPLVGELRNHATPRVAGEAPLQTLAASGNHHFLMAPEGAFYVKNYGGNARPKDMVKPVDEPLGTVTAKDHHSLVIPFRKGATPYPAGTGPLSTVTTREQHGVSTVAVDINDVRFRMLKPREHLRAQRFPRDYIVHGNQGEQTMQAGNAVSVNAAHWLAERVKAVL